MRNKPRSPESRSSNLFRAALLMALTPACATTSLKLSRVELDDDVNTRINKPVTYTFVSTRIGQRTSADQPAKVDENFEEKLNLPVPQHVENQLIEIRKFSSNRTFVRQNCINKNCQTSFNQRAEISINIDPIRKPEEECKTIPYSDTLSLAAFNRANELPNIFLLTDFLSRISVDVRGMNSKDAKSISDEDVVDIADINYASTSEISFRQVLNGYKIERTNDGVKFSARLVQCQKQRQNKAADIAAEVRAKLARGPKAGKRR